LEPFNGIVPGAVPNELVFHVYRMSLVETVSDVYFQIGPDNPEVTNEM
jgi:hypothetical protein